MTQIEVNNKTYHYQEIPNTDNKEVLEFLVYIQTLYNICRKLLISILRENKKVKTTIGFVGGIIDRISESLISIMLLSSKGLSTDVAIILVNLIELRTDLKYISKKPNKIEEWFNHGKRWTKPWRFSNQIKEITNNEKELELEKTIYEACSIAKHGNPVGYDIGFNIGLKDNGIFYTKSNKEYRLTDYLFWTYVYTSDSIKSSLDIVYKFGINLSYIIDELDEVSKRVEALFKRILNQKVMDYVYRENPELVEIDKELERLQLEEIRLKAEIESIEKQIRK